MSPELPGDTVREYAAALVRNGVLDVEGANRQLAARQVPLLNVDAVDLVQQRHDRLVADPEFGRKYLAGDPDAVRQLTALQLRLMQGGQKLADSGLTPQSYDLTGTVARLSGLSDTALRDYDASLRNWAADLQLPPETAKTLAQMHLDAAQRESTTTADQFAAYGAQQMRDLAAVCPDFEARAAAATKGLDKTPNLIAVAKSNGAELALHLLHHFEALPKRRA
jgi:hypothetical protein